MIQIDEHIFQMGLFNHPLGKAYFPHLCPVNTAVGGWLQMVSLNVQARDKGWLVSSAREGMGDGRSNRLYMVVTGYLGGPMKLVIEVVSKPILGCKWCEVLAYYLLHLKVTWSTTNTTTTTITMMFLPQTCPIAPVFQGYVLCDAPELLKNAQAWHPDENDRSITAPAVILGWCVVF